MAQTEIKGTVYDRSLRNEMQGVDVLSSSGARTVTDTLGRYHISLSPSDSIYFSYLGKKSRKFPVKDIAAPLQNDISLDAVVTVTLAPVLVSPNSYHLDSLENRRENEKIFDFEKDSPLEGMKSGRGRSFGVGLDFDMFFNGQARINKSRLSVQRWFEEDERQNYINHRFSKAIVKKLTGLESPALDTFMVEYRPTYDFVKACTTDIELYQNILDWSKSFSEEWKYEHPASTMMNSAAPDSTIVDSTTVDSTMGQR
jgi:hypothetical protein